MSNRSSDPYGTLGVGANASDADVRAAYRRLVQLHHPDHNAGSAESARRFEAVQEAYAQIRTLRGDDGRADGTGRDRARSAPEADTDHPDPVASRLADIERELKVARAARERELRTAREARERARRAARETASEPTRERASDEELGYVTTDDSFAKILADAASELSDRVADAREHRPGDREHRPADAREHRPPKRLSDLIDELGAKLTGDRRQP